MVYPDASMAPYPAYSSVQIVGLISAAHQAL